VQLRYVAAAFTLAQGFIWLAIQPGVPAMADITGEDDGSLLQGLVIAIPAVILASAFAISIQPWLFLAWNAAWTVLWALYSAQHLARWASDASSAPWLLIPELFVALHALALIFGVVGVVSDRSRAIDTAP
jgi:hypothetical protein